MKNIYFIVLAIVLSSFLLVQDKDKNETPDNLVLPTEAQVKYQEMEVIGFLHFNMNTFTDKEWGFGDEDPALFNPIAMNAAQWVEVAQLAGIKELILTAKHHDGFCLWPSKFTEHSVKNSPFRNGRADVVGEFVKACRYGNIKAGLYLSPWDRNNKDYGTPYYISYYRNQLRELLSNYGEISELWLDGANGGDGYYGGARDSRKIDPNTYYQWDSTIRIAKSLQPKIMVFSDAGPDIHWIGNESGYADKTFWSTLNTENLVIGASDTKYLNTGDPEGKQWIIGQCDVSVRPGWFYHQKEDTMVKSPQQLVDLYYKSVGRNAVLLLNIPPNRLGLICDSDKSNLKQFRAILDESFKTNLVSGGTLKSNTESVSAVEYLIDNDNATYWLAKDNDEPVELTITFRESKQFDRIMLQEPIRIGQRISSFEVLAWNNNEWKRIAGGTTIGYKRLLRIAPVETKRVKIMIRGTKAPAALSNFGLYKASRLEGVAEIDN